MLLYSFQNAGRITIALLAWFSFLFGVWEGDILFEACSGDLQTMSPECVMKYSLIQNKYTWYK